MPIVYSCIAPHGTELIPKLANSKRMRMLFEPTRLGMEKIAKEMENYRPETIVVASPHNLRLLNHMSIVLSENSTGRLSENGASVSVHAKCDVKLAKEIYAEARKRKLPLIGSFYGTFEGETSDLAMDWGTLVPVWFFVKPEQKLVIVSPNREITLRQNYEFGRVIADVAERAGKKRIAFVASADQAHAHRKEGPYGFNKSAKLYDDLVLNLIKRNSLEKLLDIDAKFVEKAKPDSLWQLLMLAGLISRVQSIPVFYSYDVPTYYGMICAGFQRL